MLTKKYANQLLKDVLSGESRRVEFVWEIFSQNFHVKIYRVSDTIIRIELKTINNSKEKEKGHGKNSRTKNRAGAWQHKMV